MSVISTLEVLNFIGSKDTQLIPRIDAMIPVFEAWITKHLNNYFDTINWVESGNISFDADANTISDSENDLAGDEDIAFSDGMDFRVVSSVLNDGIYSASTVSGGTITLDDKYSVVDESFSPEQITIIRIVWPQGIKYPAAKALEFDLGKTRSVLEAPSRQNASDIDKSYRYPKQIMEMFRPWVRMNREKWDNKGRKLTGRFVVVK